MKEILNFRVPFEYAHILFAKDEGRIIYDEFGKPSMKEIELTKNDPRYEQIPVVEEQIRKKYKCGFFFSWQFKRQYTKKEIEKAVLFHVLIKHVIGTVGEECGTIYDESVSCKICKANPCQKTPLRLRKRALPKKDIIRTLSGEIVVSEKFKKSVEQHGIRGCMFGPVLFGKKVSNFYQLTATDQLELTPSTVVGCEPFDLSTSYGHEVYKCPNGDTIGLNLLSEPHVFDNPLIYEYGFLESRQRIGVRRGVFYPNPIYFASQAFRTMVEEEKIKGLKFEITHVE